MTEQTRIQDGELHLGGADDLSIHLGDKVSEPIAMHGSKPVVQRVGADQAALAAYVTGAFGLDSDANMQAMFDLLVEIRAALVEKGIIKGSA